MPEEQPPFPPILLDTSPIVDDGWTLGPILERYLEGLNDAPSTRKRGIYSPSGLAKCARALYYNRSGVPQRAATEPRTRFNLDIGHAVHALLNRYVAGAFPDGLVQTEVDSKLEYYQIHGELDMQLLFNPGGEVRRIVDFKTIKSAKFADLKQPRILADGSVSPLSMTDYVWQLHAYMAAKNCKLGTLFYVNKDTAEWFEARITFSHAIWALIERRIIEVEQALQDGVPPARIKNAFFCPGCAWYYCCRSPEALANEP